MFRALRSAAILSFALLAPVMAAAETASFLPVAPHLRPPESGRQDSAAMIADVLSRIRSGYVENVPEEKLVQAAIDGMMAVLDPHSAYMDAEKFGEMKMKTNGEFGGLGVQIEVEDGLVRVLTALEGTPAGRAGIRTGDVLTSLDGMALDGRSTGEVMKMMRGKPGSPVLVTVRHSDGRVVDIALTREVIKTQPVRYRAIGDIGYIRITNFDRQSGPGLADAMATLRAELGGRMAGIVLDLRNNPGGLVTQAVEVADGFLDDGMIVSTRGRGGAELRRYHARPGDLAQGLPMVVLVNSGSASAAEIVAGALQDNGRAVLMGEQTYGKGSVQTIIPLGQGSGMKMTTARYYTPSGRSIQSIGIVPDIGVAGSPAKGDAPARRREADLPNALDNDAPPAETHPRMEIAAPVGLSDDDFQLDRAVDLLAGVPLKDRTGGRVALQDVRSADSAGIRTEF
jgi:carboxyl-terminal processing protease